MLTEDAKAEIANHESTEHDRRSGHDLFSAREPASGVLNGQAGTERSLRERHERKRHDRKDEDEGGIAAKYSKVVSDERPHAREREFHDASLSVR